MSDDLDDLNARLRALKVPPAKEDFRGRLDALKGPQTAALPESEIHSRFAKLTGNDLTANNKQRSQIMLEPKPKTEAEEVEDLLEQISAEAAIDNGDDAILQEYAQFAKQPSSKSKVSKPTPVRGKTDSSFDAEVSNLLDEVKEKVKRKQETGVDSDPEVLDSDDDPHNAKDIIKQAAIEAAIAKKYGDKDEESPVPPEEEEPKKVTRQNKKKGRRKGNGSSEDESEHSHDEEEESGDSDGGVSKHRKNVDAAKKKANQMNSWYNKYTKK
jgi:hypothetical protein